MVVSKTCNASMHPDPAPFCFSISLLWRKLKQSPSVALPATRYPSCYGSPTHLYEGNKLRQQLVCGLDTPVQKCGPVTNNKGLYERKCQMKPPKLFLERSANMQLSAFAEPARNALLLVLREEKCSVSPGKQGEGWNVWVGFLVLGLPISLDKTCILED